MTTVKIEKANIKDVNPILEIIKELSIPKESQKISGFVDYPLPKINTLINQIKESEFIYVARQEDKIIGFITAYQKEALIKEVISCDPILNYFAKIKNKNFIYIDLLGIRANSQNKGIGKELIKEIINNSKDTSAIYTAIVEKPHYNVASINLVNSFGFIKEKEITINKLTFGIYKKRISS